MSALRAAGVVGAGAGLTYPERVLRALLTPRWLGSFGLALLAVAACVWLGLWQLGVARDEGLKDAVVAAGTTARAPLPEVLAAHAPFPAELSNRPVSVTGRYDAQRSFVVVDRRLGDRSGAWVVSPLDTPAGTVAVLRGFLPGAPARAPVPPPGVVTVEGTLGPGESPRTGPDLGTDRRRSIDLAELVNQWPGELYNAVVFASGERVADVAAGPVDPATGLLRVPPPTLDAPLNFKNAAYAVQWWVFGVFAIWMWWKMFRTEQQELGPVPARKEEVTA